MFDLYKYSPISYNAILSEEGLTGNTGTVGAGILNGKNYKIKKWGKAVHGLNVNDTIINFNDFATPMTYVGGVHYNFLSYISYGSALPTWNGTNMTTFYKKLQYSQLSGYRSGDCSLIEVPGLNYSKQNTPLEEINSLAFKDYCLISGREKHVNFQNVGNAISRNQVICSFGVGRTFLITLSGYTSILTGASAGTTSKFHFNVIPFGLIASKQDQKSFLVDTQVVDRANNTTSLLTQYCAAVGVWEAEIIDQNKTGNKIIIALSRVSDSFPTGDDGFNRTNSYPYAFCEITFIEGGVNYMSGSYSLLYNYKGGSSATNNLIYSDGNLPGQTTNDIGTYITSNGKKIWLGSYQGVGSPYSTIPTASCFIYTVTTSNGPGVFNCDVVSNTTSSFGIMRYKAGGALLGIDSFPGDGLLGGSTIGYINGITLPGDWYYTSYPSNVNLTRVFHCNYNDSGGITVCKFSYRKVTGGSLSSFNYSGSANATSSSVKLYPSQDSNGSGGATIVVSSKSQVGDYILSYSLIIDDNVVDEFKFIQEAPNVTTRTSTRTISHVQGTSFTCGYYTYWSKTDVNSGNITSSNPNSAPVINKLLPNNNVISFFGISGYSINTVCMDGYYLDDAGIRIIPFCKIESNKLVSFNIALGSTFEVQKLKVGTGFMKAGIEFGGNHAYKATYNLHNVGIAANNTSFYNAPNPGYDVNAGYKSSLNPKTGECILYYPTDVCWV